jgi:hypothetical protein
MRVALFVASLMLAVGSPSAAQSTPNPDNGNGLQSDCESNNSYERGLCTGYVFGVVNELVREGHICPPSGAVAKQGRDIVMIGFRNHPEERQKRSTDLILKYLISAGWGCPRK